MQRRRGSCPTPSRRAHPALASLGSTSENFTFYLAWMANGLVDYRACFPNRCWTASKFVPEALTDDAPALAVENYTVVGCLDAAAREQGLVLDV